jgi:hypothetical protein
MTVMAVHVTLGGPKPAGDAPPWLGMIVVFLIGIAIAAGNTVGRIRQTEANKLIFGAGYSAADRDQMIEVRDRQLQIMTALDEAKEDRLNLVRDLQREISRQ